MDADTTGIVELKLTLNYEKALAIVHSVLAQKCGMGGTWHGFKDEAVPGGTAFRLWCVGVAGGQQHRQDTGCILVYTDSKVLFQPYGVRDTDNTHVLPSPSVGDTLPSNDFPQIARAVIEALRDAQRAPASSTASTLYGAARMSIDGSPYSVEAAPQGGSVAVDLRTGRRLMMIEVPPPNLPISAEHTVTSGAPATVSPPPPAGGQSGKQVKPKRVTTEAKWKRLWGHKIEPLFRQGDDIQVIAEKTKLNRDTVSKIITWATQRPT